VSETFVLGIDLAGPSNPTHTVAAGFRAAKGSLHHRFHRADLGDPEIQALFEKEIPAEASLVIGLDAPLSYHPGGGDRPADRDLRHRLIAAGLPPGTVMAPTMSRMAYLTLRGVVVARTLTTLRPRCRLVEVHPAGAMALRGASVTAVRALKRSARERRTLVRWLGT